MSTISPPRPQLPPKRRAGRRTHRTNACLCRYIDARGDEREVLCRPGVGGSVLVVDRLTVTQTDVRLVAHLAADEPAENAHIVASLYLNDERSHCCRRLTQHDLQTAPLTADDSHTPDDARELDVNELVDPLGHVYWLESVDTGMSIPELRWWRKTSGEADTPPAAVSVREVIASLESYEPVRSITARALATHARDPRTSTSVVRAELRRLDASPIVLNRGLRDAVLAAVMRGVSMSEIAIRCGRVKRSARGNISGETSWLARRIGQLPEGGEILPTPWIHSETLALIARQGLGIAPREVELG
jgi:hypothetical protein